MTRLLTPNHVEFIEDFLRREIGEQKARGGDIDPMQLRAHALNEFRSHYSHNGRGNWNKELEAEVGTQIDDILTDMQERNEI